MPPRDIVRLIALVAKPEIAVRRGPLDRRGHALAVGDAERQSARPQAIEDIRVVPRHMPELESRPHPRWQDAEKLVEHGQILLEGRRQLKQQHAQFRPRVWAAPQNADTISSQPRSRAI